MSQNQNAAIHFIDRHVAEGRGDRIAFQEADGRRRALTYAGLREQAGRFAGALYRHGVRREERVAMIIRDQIEFPIVFWGALKAGVIPVPLNTLLAAPVYEAILTDSRASILIVSEELWEVVKPAIDGNRYLRAVLVIGASDGFVAPEGCEDWATFLAGAPVEDTVEAHCDELAFWLYSSGSTGVPKGVRHVHGVAQGDGGYVRRAGAGSARRRRGVFRGQDVFRLWAGQCDELSHGGRGDHGDFWRSAHAGGDVRHHGAGKADPVLRGADAVCGAGGRTGEARRQAGSLYPAVHLGGRGVAA